MPLKLKVESLNDVAEQLRAAYREQDGGYVLDIDGVKDPGTVEDVSGALRAKKLANEDAKKFKEENSGLREKIETLTFDVDKLSAQLGDNDPGEMATLKAKVKKYEGDLTTLNDTLEGERTERVTEQRDSRIANLASELTTVPDIAASFLRESLKGEYVDGKFQLTPVDSHGKPTGQSEQEFIAEMQKSEKIKGILKAGQGSGSGAAGNGNGNGGGASGKIDFATATTKEKVAHRKAQRAQH